MIKIDTLPTGTGAASLALTSLSLLGLVNIDPNPVDDFITISEAAVDDVVPTVGTTGSFCFFLLYVRLLVFYYMHKIQFTLLLIFSMTNNINGKN